MTGVITWTFDSGDGVCIEREQPSTALKPMPHFTTFDSFSAGPDVYHPEFQPELNDFEIPHGPHFHGHDPVTGLDTGSGNDLIPDEPPGPDSFTTGAGGDSFNCDDILLGHGVGLINHDHLQNVNGTIGYEMQARMGISANARGNTTGTIAALQIDTGSGNDHIVHHIGTTSGPGGTTYMTGVDHLGQFGHEADHFTNFAMPVGDFI